MSKQSFMVTNPQNTNIPARLRMRISKSAVSKWVTDFNPPYLAIRKMNAGHKPIIRAHLFTHRGLNYNYQVHQPKLAFCKREGLTRYLNWVPEHIDAALFEEGSRCSQLKLARNPGLYHVTHSPLNRLTEDASRLAATNRDRHTAVDKSKKRQCFRHLCGHYDGTHVKLSKKWRREVWGEFVSA